MQEKDASFSFHLFQLTLDSSDKLPIDSRNTRYSGSLTQYNCPTVSVVIPSYFLALC